MAPITNGRVLFNSIPEGFKLPEVGKTTIYDTTETIDTDTVPLDGGFLIKTLEISIDPFLRGRMRQATVGSHIPTFTIGQPLNGNAIGIVVRSEYPQVKVGDHVRGYLEHANYSIKKDLTHLEIVGNPDKLPWSAFIGVLGMPGKTAFAGWKEYSRAKKGETVFVTTGAGAVGSLVVQLAKMDGLKVIASAGSDEKVQFMKELGADVAFNYKTTKTADVLAKEGPIDVYWDNVGGETLDVAIEAANIGTRFIECGMISGYNNGFTVPVTSISMHGFNITRLEPKWREEFIKTIPPLVASGKIKYKEDVSNGLETVTEALVSVLTGTNKAKAVVHVTDE